MAEVGIRRKLRKRKWTDCSITSSSRYYKNIMQIKSCICNYTKCSIGSNVEVVASEDEYGRKYAAYGIKDNTPSIVIDGKQHMIEIIIVECSTGIYQLKLSLYRLDNRGIERLIANVKRRGQIDLFEHNVTEAVNEFISKIMTKM